MYNTQKMIKTEKKAIESNPDMDVRVRDFQQIKAGANGSEYEAMSSAFLFGVAVGMKLAADQGIK